MIKIPELLILWGCRKKFSVFYFILYFHFYKLFLHGYMIHVLNSLHQPMCSSSCLSSVFLLPQFFLWMWISFFLISPSALFWNIYSIAASREVHYVQLYHSVSGSVYNVLLVLLLSLCISSWRTFQFTWNSRTGDSCCSWQ